MPIYINPFILIFPQVFDAGKCFGLVQDEDDKLHAICNLEDGVITSMPEECIFLIDHAWTYRANDAREQLTQNDGGFCHAAS